MVAFGILEGVILGAGIIYGYVNPGKEDREGLMRMSIKHGLVLGIVLGAFSYVNSTEIIFTVIMVSIVFVIGTFIGDIFEEQFKNK